MSNRCALRLKHLIYIQSRRQGTSIRGAFGISRGEGKNPVVCGGGGGVWVGSMQSVQSRAVGWRSLKRAIAFLCALFYWFHFRFQNRSHSARRGEKESGGHSNSFGGTAHEWPLLGAGPAYIRAPSVIWFSESILPKHLSGTRDRWPLSLIYSLHLPIYILIKLSPSQSLKKLSGTFIINFFGCWR